MADTALIPFAIARLALCQHESHRNLYAPFLPLLLLFFVRLYQVLPMLGLLESIALSFFLVSRLQ